MSETKKLSRQEDNKEFLYSSSWTLWLGVIYISIRVGLANLAPITDCDEVYNYWEPLHFLHHQSGMQTWEYSPEFALRTYAYLMPLLGLSRFYELLVTSWSSSQMMMINWEEKVVVFQMLRCTLALVMALSEWNLCLALKDSLFHNSNSNSNNSNNNNNNQTKKEELEHPSNNSSNSSEVVIPVLFGVTMLTSAGMFHASPALLPSATVMMLWMNSAASQLRNQYTQAIAWGLVAVLAVGWPFCAVLFTPLAMEALLHHRSHILQLLVQTASHAIIIQIFVSLVDYIYYDNWVFPTLNIFLYNTSGGGDELYGVEPTSYYIKNILLNWNYIGILGIISLPLLILINFLFKRTTPLQNKAFSKLSFIMIPMYLWLLIVVPRPHKEERFLFPIYPILCIGFATLCDSILHIIIVAMTTASTAKKETIHNNKQNHTFKFILGFLVIVPAALLSISRSIALSDGYTAPLHTYASISMSNDNHNDSFVPSGHTSSSSQQQQQQLFLCTCGEWYRFPSSFMLPNNVHLAYLKSSFSGQLPQPFTQYGSKPQSLTVDGVGKFNDLNQEEMDRYVTIDQCHYIVELIPTNNNNNNNNMSSQLPECMKYMEQEKRSSKWKQVSKYPFLDAESTSTIHRVLYLPWIRKPDKNVHYHSYVLFQREQK